MKIQFASDLHLEFQSNTFYLQDHPLDVKGDILVLAGDIAYLGRPILKKHPFFDWCSENYRHTYIVPGNHEYYSSYPLENTLGGWEMQVRENVSYLNNKSIHIGDTEIFFTTLWTVLEQIYEMPIERCMNDFRVIRYNGETLRAADYGRLHRQSMEWLEGALSHSDAPHKVVVTHHCPTRRSAFNNHPDGVLNTAFMVDLDSFIQAHPDIEYWIFGHTHYNGGPDTEEGRVGSTQLLCNQMGYVVKDENKWFKLDSYIEL